MSCLHTYAQKRVIREYLKKHQQEINLAAVNEIHHQTSFLNHDLYFFGFIHGGVTPQEVDFILLKSLHQQAGLKYYAPEVDPSMAFFLNQYLITGDENLLKTLTKFYEKRVPQDAGIEWMEKWQKIRQLNLQTPETRRIRVLGTDFPISANLTLAHLASFLPKNKTGISTIDSLSHFSHLYYPEQPAIWSGKPILESGKPWSDYFPDPAASYFDRLFDYIKENANEASHVFGQNWELAKSLIETVDRESRETVIFENFQKQAIPLMRKGEKIYANFGYFHIQQGKINGRESVAFKLQNSLDKDLSMVSIQGLLAKSSVLKEKKFTKAPEIMIKDLRFTGMAYNGFKHSRSWDGDSFFERAKGIGILKRIVKTDVILIDLNKEGSPFKSSDYLAAFSRGGKKWKLEKDQSTTDYFQYIIYIQNSAGICPLEELD
ncbi:MAG: erythromycin esterase family protein [Roseivirga sp.]|nr:erythromycin esterase family protein [Roseivirga sp.]